MAPNYAWAREAGTPPADPDLPAGEVLVLEAKRHWSRYARATLMMLLGIVGVCCVVTWNGEIDGFINSTNLFRGNPTLSQIKPSFILACISGAIVVIGFLWRVVKKQKDSHQKMFLTNNYLTLKDGWFSSQTQSLSLEYVELANIFQPFFGKVFGYGNIEIISTGKTKARYPSMANAVTFRNKLMECCSAARNRKNL